MKAKSPLLFLPFPFLAWLFLSGHPLNAAGGEGSPYLSLKAAGVDAFLKEHPTCDGRGVVIFVLDNGADVGVPGLLETTTGEKKFIDARDFTGEGDVDLERVDLNPDGSLASRDGSLRVDGVGRLKQKAAGGAYRVGVLEEERFKNSEFAEVTGKGDINDNGREGDVFAVVAFPVSGEDHWVVFVDTDADGAVDDEEPHLSFAEDLKPLYFARKNPLKEIRPMTAALTILPDEEKVVFHFPDGDHATHVSGIAAGFGIEGRKGFNGVAPGARLASLKIGDDTLSGGATVTASMKDALEFVGKYAEDHPGGMVIANMSYGIGSEVEGSSEIDEFVDDFLADHPNVVLCTAAGNEGPGLSSIDTPGGAFMAVAVGAVMAKEVARNAYGAEIPGPRLLHFSSRGGELNKPDICAPGACLSSVPRWSPDSRMWGTSMASPYMAGVMALLASAAAQEFPDREVNSGLLRRAVRNGAAGIEGSSVLGQGPGLVDVPRAWELLKRYLAAEPDPVLAWRVSTLSPSAPGGESPAAYWRSVYRPGDEAQIFKVEPVFLPGTPAEAVADFFRSFALVSDAPFLKAVQDSFPVRQDHAGLVRVHYDPAALAKPGLYCGRIGAYSGGRDPADKEFDLLNTVIVPYTFGPGNHYTLEVKDATAAPLETNRYFLSVPAGATRMLVKATVPGGRFCRARISLFDPAGRGYMDLDDLNTLEGAVESAADVPEEDLTPGVWELDVWGDLRAGKPSSYDLDVAFMGFHVAGDPELELAYDPGKTPEGSFDVTNLFDEAVWAAASGEVWGYRRTLEEHMEDTDTYTLDFDLDQDLAGVRFTLEMTPETYGLFTDFAINILDEEGESLLKEGLTYRKIRFFFENPGGEGKYTLQVVAAFTHRRKKPFDFTLKEEFLRAEPVPVEVSYANGDGLIPLVPGVATRVEYVLGGVPPVAPQGFETAAVIVFKERGTEREVLRVPLAAPAGRD